MAEVHIRPQYSYLDADGYSGLVILIALPLPRCGRWVVFIGPAAPPTPTGYEPGQMLRQGLLVLAVGPFRPLRIGFPSAAPRAPKHAPKILRVPRRRSICNQITTLVLNHGVFASTGVVYEVPARL